MNTMRPLERCLTVFQGGLADRVPVVPQTFHFSMETAGIKIGEAVRNGGRMVETQVVCQEKYGYDGCVIDFDEELWAALQKLRE